jgi:hypothetical protein
VTRLAMADDVHRVRVEDPERHPAGDRPPDQLPLAADRSERVEPITQRLPHDEVVRLARQGVLKSAVGQAGQRQHHRRVGARHG